MNQNTVQTVPRVPLVTSTAANDREHRIPCTECSREFETPQALGMHRFHSHKIAGLARADRKRSERLLRRRKLGIDASLHLMCPECGDDAFCSKAGLGWHRSKVHGVIGEHRAKEVANSAKRYRDLPKARRLARLRNIAKPRGRKKNFDSTGLVEILALCKRRKAA